MIIDNNEGHILTHLGLGDQITCNGLVRELYKKHNKLYVYSKIKYYYTIEHMYKDLDNLYVLPLEENGAKIFCDYHKIKNFYRIGIGSDSTVERSFYKQAGTDFTKKFDNFYIERDKQRENILYSKFNLTPQKYVFIHDDFTRNQLIDLNKINRKELKIFKPEIEYTNNIFDYLKIIENAAEIHTIESCFMFMIDLVFKDSNLNMNLFQHRYAKPIAPYEYPTNTQNWHLYE